MCFKKYLSPIWILLLWFSSEAQCPYGDTLWNRIIRLANLSPDEQLIKLLDLQDSLKNCHSAKDSADAYLLQRIGVMYFKKTAYNEAVKYTLSALDLLYQLQRRVYINPGQKFKCYRNLNIYYDSLNMTGKRDEAIDSCISIGLGSVLNDSMLYYTICNKIIRLLNVGDYKRTVQYASLSQNLAEKYGYVNTDIIRRIFAWKINALLLLNDYPSVAIELKNKIQEYERFRYEDYIGNLYGLWARYYLGTGKTDSALFSYKKSFYFNKKSKLKEGCASSLNSIGFVYFESE